MRLGEKGWAGRDRQENEDDPIIKWSNNRIVGGAKTTLNERETDEQIENGAPSRAAGSS